MDTRPRAFITWPASLLILIAAVACGVGMVLALNGGDRRGWLLFAAGALVVVCAILTIVREERP